MTDPTPEKCDICGHVKVVPDPDNPDYNDGIQCSEFCREAPAEDKAKFKAGLKPGDFALYPCCECGCIIDDEYSGDNACCSSCHTKVRLRTRTQLLEEILQRAVGVLTGDLEARIRTELAS